MTKKNGHLQPLKAFKLKQRISTLMDGLEKDFVDVDFVVQKVTFHIHNKHAGKQWDFSGGSACLLRN